MSLLYNPTFAAPCSPAPVSAPVPAAAPVRTIKVKYNDDFRRFPFPVDASAGGQYDALMGSLASSYGVAREALCVQYVDDEGDLVTVGSDAELAEAIRCNDGTILRLTLSIKPAAVAASGVAAVASDARASRADHAMPLYPQLENGRGAWGRGGCGGGGGRGMGLGPGLGLGLGLGKCMAKGRLMQRREELEQKYAVQVQQLKEEGLPHGPFVLAALERLDGDMELLRDRLRARQQRVTDLESRFAGELAQLREMGVLGDASEDEQVVGAKPKFWGNPKHRCLRLLVRTDGDVDKVAKKLRKWEEKRESWKQKTDDLKTRFSDELAQLEEMGFTNTNCLIRLLNASNGDVCKVIDRLEKQQRKQQKWCGKADKKWGAE